MNHGDRRFDLWVDYVWKHRLKLSRDQHSLINQGSAGQAWHVKKLALFKRGIPHCMLNSFPNNVEFAFKCVGIGKRVTAFDEHLMERWSTAPCGGP